MSSRFRGSTVILSVVQAIVLTVFPAVYLHILSPSRVVTKISSCRVNATSRWGIEQPGISFGSIFLLFS